MKKEIIETKNVRAIKNAVRDTVNQNGYLAIIAEIGSGKTQLFNILTEYWSQYPHKFSVVKIKSFKHSHSRISSIMEFLLEAIEPGIFIPWGIEKRYLVLSEKLRSAGHQKRIILIADEAQDFNLQTFKDLKKIHEIDGNGQDHLFSIILFGKTDRQWDRIFSMPELGMRIRETRLDKLNAEEIILIAEKTFGLRFQNDKIRDRFAASVNFKTPLGVEFAANAIRMQYGLSRDDPASVTSEVIEKLPFMSLKFRFRQAGFRNKDLVEFARESGTSRKVSEQRVSELFSGTLEDDDFRNEMIALTETLIKERFSDRKTPNAIAR